jgi:hypothetical protein
LDTANVLPQCLIDQSLIISASGAVYLLVKPFENVVIDSDRDSRLALRHGNYRPPFRLAEIVFAFSVSFHVMENIGLDFSAMADNKL